MKLTESSLFVSLIFVIFIIPLKAQTVISIPNFDVREKFRNCYNHGYSSDYKDIECSTNWQIQFSLMLTDKSCILFGDENNKSKRLISSMNFNSCINFGDKPENCKSLSKQFLTFSHTEKVIYETIR